MRALQLPSPLRVIEVRDRTGFMSLMSEWNSLVERTRNEVFYRHEFLRVWLDNFAPEATLRILTVRTETGALVAALPLLAQTGTMYGMPVRQWVAAANSHSCRFDLIAEDAVAASAALLSYLRANSNWDVLRIVGVPPGGAAFAFLNTARAAGMPAGMWSSLNSPYIPLPNSWDALAARLQSKFKANVRRRRRKLEDKGRITFERVDGGLELAQKLEEGFILEQSGWKGQNGTAMAQDSATRGFYTELARTSSYAGQLCLYCLRLDGRPVAFQYGLVFDKRFFLLKPGYDESLKECSPGHLLMEEALRDCIARGLSEFDFLGPDMVWKRDWTDCARQHVWLYVFRNSALGRALHAAKFRWVPAAKEAVARWRK